MLKLANVDDLRRDNQEALDTNGAPEVGRWVNGRIVGVLASPELANATDLAIGVSALPAGTETPVHAHRAEEIAVVIAGSGEIVIDAARIAVRAGDIVRTPSSAPHLTRASPGEALHVLWVYAPAGSEGRWLADQPNESGDDLAGGGAW